MFKENMLRVKLAEICQWFAKELSVIRTGRASPSLLDGVMVESYGTMMNLSHTSVLSIEDARTIRISPWDKTLNKAIESAIHASNLGVSVVPDALGLRVSFPELSNERREFLRKLLKEKLEQARVSVRKEREATNRLMDESVRNKETSEDEARRQKLVLQKLIDECNDDLDEAFLRKEKELSL